MILATPFAFALSANKINEMINNQFSCAQELLHHINIFFFVITSKNYTYMRSNSLSTRKLIVYHLITIFPLITQRNQCCQVADHNINNAPTNSSSYFVPTFYSSIVILNYVVQLPCISPLDQAPTPQGGGSGVHNIGGMAVWVFLCYSYTLAKIPEVLQCAPYIIVQVTIYTGNFYPSRATLLLTQLQYSTAVNDSSI